MSTIYDHKILEVPESLEDLVTLLREKYAEGWHLNSLQLVKIAEEQPAPEGLPDVQ